MYKLYLIPKNIFIFFKRIILFPFFFYLLCKKKKDFNKFLFLKKYLKGKELELYLSWFNKEFFDDVYGKFSNEEIKPTLSFGSLAGAVYLNEPFGNDYDVDMFLLESVYNQEDLIKKFNDYECFYSTKNCSKFRMKKFPYLSVDVYSLKFDENNAYIIDKFLYDKKDKEYIEGRIVFPKDYIGTIKEIKLNSGADVLIYGNGQKISEATYGTFTKEPKILDWNTGEGYLNLELLIDDRWVKR